ncbi:MFS transporter [Pokkaliibacter sp. MBI-7]|uniref:MFS transporter n=1 Tax=Pokkaliibacter sp. MBI-7 TaxID=3040600 RepID=UPI003266D86A
MENTLDQSAIATPAAPVRPEPHARPAASPLVLPVVAAASFVHLLNDLIQATLPAIYPMLKTTYSLSFAQIGLITLVFQLTASVLQPGVGFYTDKHPKPYLLPTGMLFTFIGLLMLATVNSFELILLASAFIGLGSSTFHPEASRVARMASGGRFGFAQSFFQVGGNAGSALGPLLAAAIVIPRGQGAISWFLMFAVLGIVVLSLVSRWVVRTHAAMKGRKAAVAMHNLPRDKVIGALLVLAVLVFSKYIYMASMTNYYAFYLMDQFGLSVQKAQLFLFLFMAAVALGTFIGGPIGDRVGRKAVIWVSILGVAPFTLLLPYANLFWASVLTVIIGIILSSAFSAIVVFAQELVPGKVGLIAGIFFGLMFGFSGIAAAALGMLADMTSIRFVFEVCAFLPLLGIFTVLLPNIEQR